MMKTTNTLVHRLNVFLGRQKDKLVETTVLMQELRERYEASNDMEQTVNHEGTDTEKSEEAQPDVEPTKLGMAKENSAFDEKVN